MDHNTDTRCKKRVWYLQLCQPDKLAVDKLSREGHLINFEDNMKLTRTGYVGQIVKQTTETWLHPKNFNKDIRFTMNQS
jgi:hypothetical protein